MKRAFDDEVFRRYCGLVGRDPTLPSGQRSKSGKVAPWSWRRFDDVPPPRAEGAQSLEGGNRERNGLMDKY
eukprot:1570186-Alexandrium_andersonii.AAC.1